MPNYRQKNRNRNKNKNRHKHQQQQQQQQQQETTKKSETSVGDKQETEDALTPSNAESQSIKENVAETTVCGKETKEPQIAYVPPVDVDNVISCGTVPSEPAEKPNENTSSETSTETCVEMGNEKSKIVQTPQQDNSRGEVKCDDTQKPADDQYIPSTPRQQAKVIVHRVVCENISEITHQTTKDKNDKQKEEKVETANENTRESVQNIVCQNVSEITQQTKEEVNIEEVTKENNVQSVSDEIKSNKKETPSMDSSSDKCIIEQEENKELCNKSEVKVIIHQIQVEDEEEESKKETCTFSPVHIEEIGEDSLTDLDEIRSPVVSEVESSAEYEDADTESDDIAELTSTTISQREKRKQKRLALESHFLPQMLNPRFLDSISEENSDLSECGENPLSRSASAESASSPKEQKAQKHNAKFPKSSLDFSKTHKHTLPPHPQSIDNVIREEPVALTVEARYQEAVDADESCTTLKGYLSPEAEVAEMVFINSASSSMSDLNEMDVFDRVSLHSASSLKFDLDTDAKDLINKPGKDKILTSSSSTASLTSTNVGAGADDAASQTNNANENTSKNVNNSHIPPSVSSPAIDQLVYSNAKEEQNRFPSKFPLTSTPLSCASSGQQQRCAIDDALRLLSDAQASLLETSCETIKTKSVSSLRADKNAKPPPQVLTENVQNMNTVRDILNTDNTQSANKNDLKLKTSTATKPQPPEDHQLVKESPDSPTDPKKLRLLCAETLAALPYGDEVLEELATLAKNIGEVKAVNVVKTHTSENPTTQTPLDMPYPPPELPHIDDLQLCLQKSKADAPGRPPSPKNPESWLGIPTNADPKVLVCLSPSQRSFMQQQKVVTTTSSKESGKPDELLDAHQRFVERRGYHEYSKEQLANLEREKLAEQQLLQTAAYMKKLRKSLTPPPPQIPPPPVPAKSSETAAIAQNLSKRSIASTSSSSTTVANTIKTKSDVTPSEGDKKEQSDGEENRHRLLSIIHDTSDTRRDAQQQQSQQQQQTQTQQQQKQQQQSSTAATSSYENNSRQTATSIRQHPATPQKTAPNTFIIPIELTNGSSSTTTTTKPRNPFNFPTVSGSMQGVETTLSEMFPTLGSSDIFDSERKRFSNIESSAMQPLVDTKPKRYSCIESHSYESEKRMQNGQLIHDFSNSKHEKQKYGDAPEMTNTVYTKFPLRSPLSSDAQLFSSAPTPSESTQNIRTKPDDHEIMSALKLNKHSSESLSTGRQTTSHIMSSHIAKTESSESSRRDEVDFVKQQNNDKEQQIQNATERMTALKRGIQDTYEEFRQRAKEAAANTNNTIPATATTATTPMSNMLPTAQVTSNGESTANGSSVISSSSSATTTKKTVFQHDHEKLFKEFDDLSKQLNKELEMGKTQKDQKEKSASLFDLNRINLRQKEQIEEFNKQRHSHMKELEQEIERSMKSRQLRMGSLERTYSADFSNGRTHQIPVHIENGNGATAYTNGNTTPSVPEPPRSYQIPIHLENGSTVADNRNRRAESMFNLCSEETHRQRTYSNQRRDEDDWSKYASDLGSSENIARPFAKEVEICYQRRPGGIRAPRMSASTSDLSYSTQSFDQHNAYNVRRSHAPMLNRAPQQNRPHYGSCYSMIERDPNPKYISTTSRRGVSPAPQTSGFHPIEARVSEEEMRQRRASLPRELHEQQLKYIQSKEEELRTEFERLQNERRRLMEEMNQASTMPLPQPSPRLMRDPYRSIPKLPPLSEDEVFRQQMAEEWMKKVAEREERRLQNIIKISKLHEDEVAAAQNSMQKNLGDEFLNRVKERRTKLSMPADSDWESGAESQPANQGQFSETEDIPPVKIIEGENEANLRSLPRHLREFAKFSNHQRDEIEGGHREQHQEEERSQEATDNSYSKAFKKSTVVKTVKTLRAPMLPENGGQDTKGHRKHTNENHIAHQRSKDTSNACRNVEHYRTVNGDSVSRRTKKQTRFMLPANRRSWSESDLLQEIDQELKLAKGFLFQDVYNVKYEYMSEPETENERPRKMAQLARRQYDGIGPTTNDGMPIILRSEVKEPHQHEWYKRLYQTIHKQKHGDDYVIRYKQPRGRSLGKANGYQSEPEPSYDSDYSTIKYRPVNTQRLQSASSAINVRNTSNDKIYGTLPNPVKSGQNTYKNQPGRIENYVTGHSSISEKEAKENLDQAKLSSNYTEGNLSRALAKESGYASDSNLVFRKKEVNPNSPLSPVEQKQAYKTVQAGGEPPLFGFRKPAPEKSRVSPNRYYESDVNIHFKTPVRQEFKSPLSEEELSARQAEHMQKLYQEERRRKYLQELQDMNSRRHTDNFTPSQKSPIALNRYDDFPADLAPKSNNQIKSVARALYNFQAQNSKELSFKKGDIIYVRRAIDKNWYEGEHMAMIGLFPANYVEIIKEPVHSVQSLPAAHRKPSEGQARAKYNFQAQSGVELSLNKGELVALTRRVDDNWFEGRIANRKGIFPVSYVEVLTDIGAEDIAARTTTIQHVSTVNARPNLDALRTNINNEFNTLTRNGAQAPNTLLRDSRTNHKTDILHVDTSSEPLVYRSLYKYRPQNSDELELLEGDIVHVLEKCDDGWYVGTSQRTGCFGTFPGNYVERV